MNICQSEWSAVLGKSVDIEAKTHKKRDVKEGLVGKISLGHDDRPYCFINTDDGQSFFCSKSVLPSNIRDGDEVCFDAIPSFDKKKNKESWKASNVRFRA